MTITRQHQPSLGLATVNVVPELVLIAPILSPLYYVHLPPGFWVFWLGVLEAVFISRTFPSASENFKR